VKIQRDAYTIMTIIIKMVKIIIHMWYFNDWLVTMIFFCAFFPGIDFIFLSILDIRCLVMALHRKAGNCKSTLFA